ncbi:MAG: murein hydrolase activator EnvC family protein, partial [Muribaculaceae bacterium]
DSRAEMLQELETELQKLEAEREKCAKVVASLRKDQKRLKQILEQRQAEEDKLNNELHRLIKEKEEEERREAERIREKARQDSILAAKKAEEEAKAREQEQQKKKNRDKKKDNSGKDRNKDKENDNKQSPKPKPQPPLEKKKPIETKPAPDFSTSGFSTLKGRLPYPVSGDIVRHFGKSQDIVTKIFRMNYGVGFCTRAGEPVSAVCDGKVSVVMRGSGFVIINHGVYNTVYRGLNGIKVAEGDSVKMGQTIGKVRTDPDDPEHCILSFEIIHNSTNIDPEPWFQ